MDKLLPKGHQFCMCEDYKLGKEGKGRDKLLLKKWG